MRKVPRNLLVWLASRRFGRVGAGLVYDPLSSRIRGHGKIFLGKRVFIGHGADFSIHERLEIGDDVLFGSQVMILSGNHPVDVVGQTINTSHQGINGRCTIERDAWIGARVIIVGGVTIGEGAVVGAQALVTRDVPPYTVAVGTPCAPLRRRFSDAELREHLTRLGRAESAEALIAQREAGFAAAGKRDRS